MKRSNTGFVVLILVVGTGLFSLFTFSSYRGKEKIKIGFLVHDLVNERWQKDMDNFVLKVEELGGEAITKNAFGDAHTQVKQGKMLIDEGVKVLAVVPEDGKVLSELVKYADKAGAKIIAYDRMIVNCNLHYYISFNSLKEGELMAEHALKIKPKGNYVIINGPSSDNNALLVRKGMMSKLKNSIDKGDIRIILDKEVGSWYALNSMILMDEFLSANKDQIDAVLAASDGLASGVIDAFKTSQAPVPPVVTGQDASIDACKNIIRGDQSMTIYKSIKKISYEAAILAMKVAKKEKINYTTRLNNGQHDVPSILFDPIMIDKGNLKQTLVAGGHVKESELN